MAVLGPEAVMADIEKGMSEDGHWIELRLPKGDGPAVLTHHLPNDGMMSAGTKYEHGFILIRWWPWETKDDHKHCSCVFDPRIDS